jgi:hypothetical protein
MWFVITDLHSYFTLFHYFTPVTKVWVAYPYSMGYKKGKGDFMTTAQISERLVTYGNIKKPMALSRLGMVLGTDGYKATKRRIGNTQTRGWIVYQRDTDEISALRRILKD